MKRRFLLVFCMTLIGLLCACDSLDAANNIDYTARFAVDTGDNDGFNWDRLQDTKSIIQKRLAFCNYKNVSVSSVDEIITIDIPHIADAAAVTDVISPRAFFELRDTLGNVVFTSTHIDSVTLTNHGSQDAMAITLTHLGRAALTGATAAPGERLELLMDGAVLSAFTVEETIANAKTITMLMQCGALPLQLTCVD